MKAAQLNIDESRAAEITAYLRPNPDFSLTALGVLICLGGMLFAIDSIAFSD